MEKISIFLSVYGFFAISHILIQMFFAHREHQKQKSKKFVDFHQNHETSVSVIVPCFNEEPQRLNDCLESILRQEYPELEVIVIDDGSKNIEGLLTVYNKFRKHEGCKVIFQENNKGKRHAQKMGFDIAKGEIIVTIDSDTLIEIPHGIKHIVKQFKDPIVGAITGDVRVSNKKENFLTQLISYRYWSAFHQERAAQSFFDILMCCSGPFSAYRKVIVDKLKERYVSQRFLGKNCTYGDDRHLTNLILEDGHQVRFDNKAISHTHVPNTLKKYITQQVRWNKSFYREMLWTLKHVHKHHIYMLYELLMQFFLPFMFVFAFAMVVIQSILISTDNIWKYLVILISIALLRSIYGMYRTRDLGFLRFVAYGFVHVFILIPTRLYSIATISDGKWGTR